MVIQSCAMALVAGLWAGTLLVAEPAGTTTQNTDVGFRPFSFAILSDLHLSERQGIARLERALDQIGQRQDIAFVLILGDIVWDRKAEDFKPILARAKVPVHLVYGNNDWKWIKDGSYEAAYGPRDYTFTYANCTFIQMWNCLPKENPDNHRGKLSEEQWTWLGQQLEQAKGSQHTFVSMHVPPAIPHGYNKGFFMYPDQEQRLYGLFDKYAVTGAFFGHAHQADAWSHGKTRVFENPSCCWNFISKTQKVDSSFMRIVKVEKDGISDSLIPVWLDGETFTYETLSSFYDPVHAPK